MKIIAVLDLNLTLKEKIILKQIVDPYETGNVYIEFLLKKFSSYVLLSSDNYFF